MLKIFLICLLFAGLFFGLGLNALAANVLGWVWSENIGWISMNAKNANTSNPHWQLLRTADGDTSYVWNDTSCWQKDAYNVENPPSGAIIQNVRIMVQFKNGVGNSNNIAIGFRHNKNDYSAGLSIRSDNWFTLSLPISKPGGGSWTSTDIRNLQLYVGVKDGGAVSQIYLFIQHGGSWYRYYPNGPGDYTTIIQQNPFPSYSVDYGVSFNNGTGLFSGHAWSGGGVDSVGNNVPVLGWISFNQADLAGCPTTPCEARINLATGVVSGWARACAVFPDGSCSGALRPDFERGGWDGWIKLKGAVQGGSSYGVNMIDFSPSGVPGFFGDLCAKELIGFGWGGSNLTNDEAVIGWTSFNSRNCDTNNNGYSNGGAGCPPVGTIIANYKVFIDFFAVNPILNADISCNPATCSVYHRSPPSEILTLENNSTGDITESRWSIKRLGQPDSSYIERDVCSGVCDFTPQNYIGTASGDCGNYTVRLIIRDGTGATNETTRNFELKRDAKADFMCSVDDVDYKRCNEIIAKEANIFYIRGEDNSLSRYSWPSEGATISNWSWSLNGTAFGGNNSNVSIDSFPLGSFTIGLTIIDTAGRSDTMQYTLGGVLPLPKWKETAPF